MGRPVLVAGVDLSITRTGLARPDGVLVSITPPARLKGYDRHWHVAEQVFAHVAGADAIVVEGYALGYGPRMPKTLVSLAEIGGVVRTMLHHNGFPLAVISPAELKRFATGKGSATKDQMLEAATLLTADQPEDHRPENHDEADAYWLRRAGLSRYELGVTPWVLDKVDWPKARGQ